jgi:hypothetical protein
MKDPNMCPTLSGEQMFTLEEVCAKNCLTWVVAGPDFYCIPRYCKKLYQYAVNEGLNPEFFGLVGGIDDK